MVMPPPRTPTPLIKVGRWGMLAVGFFYGTTRQAMLKAKEDKRRAKEEAERPAKEAAMKAEKERKGKEEMDALGKQAGVGLTKGAGGKDKDKDKKKAGETGLDKDKKKAGETGEGSGEPGKAGCICPSSVAMRGTPMQQSNKEKIEKRISTDDIKEPEKKSKK